MTQHNGRANQWLGTWAAVVLAAPLLLGCGRGAAPAASVESSSASALPASEAGNVAAASASQVPRQPPKPADPTVVLHTTQGDIKLRLFAQQAPRTVENFLDNYANRGFYEQTIFHHVEPGVM